MKSVSIIIPIYNGESYIRQCFENICQQTYDHSAIECIFVNDGSKDNSVSALTCLVSSSHSGIRFRLISHDHNQGVSAARNTGIYEARNEYIFFMDVDDFISPECIELLIHATTTYPKATVIVGNLLNKKENTCHHTKLETICQKGHKKNLHDILLFIYTSYPVNKLILRRFILENHLFFPVGIPYFEDLHWNIDVACLSREIVYLPEITYYYEFVRCSAMSVSSSKQATIAESYISLIQKAMNLNKTGCIIETHLFIFYYIQKLLNMAHHKKYCKNYIYSIRMHLFKEAFRLRKPLLIMYDLQLFQPFRTIANLNIIRNRSAELRLWTCKKCQPIEIQ